MDTGKTRIIRLDNDELEILLYYNMELNRYLCMYPDFSENPRYTPNGRPWVNATYTDCPYSDEFYDDCGSCEFFLTEKSKDLVGICTNEINRAKGE